MSVREDPVEKSLLSWRENPAIRLALILLSGSIALGAQLHWTLIPHELCEADGVLAHSHDHHHDHDHDPGHRAPAPDGDDHEHEHDHCPVELIDADADAPSEAPFDVAEASGSAIRPPPVTVARGSSRLYRLAPKHSPTV